MHFSKLKTALQKHGGFSVDRIEEAYIFARDAHKGQMRKTGEEYITHPVAVARRLFELGGDEESIITALLHDTVEDTSITLKTIEKKFGKKVARLVDGLTKFEKNAFHGTKGLDEKIETIRKWMRAIENDLRIAVIKIVDRLDNLQSLHVFSSEKQMRISKETLEVYARVAKWLSLEEIRQELEECALSYILSAEEHHNLAKRKQKAKRLQNKAVKHIQQVYSEKDTKSMHMILRPHLLSSQQIYFAPHLPLAAYCIVHSEEECYHALSFFHQHWKQKKGSFQDYINTPKINGYCALHTTILLTEGEEIQIKIMTEEMFSYYLRGVLTFCFQKAKNKRKLPWIEKMKQLLSSNKEKSYAFWSGVQSDLLTGFIIVYGPKGKTLSLPSSSTYLDAAFAFLKKKALFVSEILSNGKPIPQRRRIPDGTRIEFVMSSSPQVQYDWLKDVDNVQSIQMIKKSLQEKKRKEKIELGKKLLQEQFSVHKMGMVDEIEEKTFLVACHDIDIHSIDELFIKIAEVQVLPSEIIARIAPQKLREIQKKGEETFSLCCEVRKDVLSEFAAFTADVIKRVRISAQKHNKNLFRVHLSCSALPQKKHSILHDIRRHRGMRILQMGEMQISFWKTATLFILLALLWGLDPIFASKLLQGNITPPFLTLIRFLVMTSVFAGVLAFQHLFSHTPKQKKISFFSAHVLFLAAMLFCIALCSYFALLTTRPSEYVTVVYPWFMIFSILLALLQGEIRKNTWLLLSVFGIFLASSLIIFQSDHWPLGGKLWTMGAAFSFILYSLTSNFFQKKYTIFNRYISYQFLISLYALFFAGISFFLFPQPSFSLHDYTLALGFSVIFTALPFLIFALLFKNAKASLTGSILLAIIPTTLLGEYIMFHKPPQLSLSLGIILLVIGLFPLFFLQKTTGEKKK